MGFIDRMVAPLERAGEPRGTTAYTGVNFFGRNSSGKHVSERSAMGLSAVWAAVWLIAELGSMLPMKVYDNRGSTLAPAPGAWQQRLMRQPNPEMSGLVFFLVLLAHIELWGEAFIGKQRVNGRVVGLWPMDPERMIVTRKQGVKLYQYTEDDGSYHEYTAADVIHVIGKTLDGMSGLSTISYHRNTFGIGQALDEHAGQTLANRGVPLGVLSVKGTIKKGETRDNLREEWDERFKRRAGQIAILDEGAQFQAVSIPLADAQFVEQRKLGVQDVARIFGIWPELIGGESGGSMTYSNVSARRSDLLTLVLGQRLGRIEAALYGDNDLFPNTAHVEPHFDPDAFLTGDAMETYQALKVATGGLPVLTQDEAREKVGRSPLGGDAAVLANTPAHIVLQPASTDDGTPA